MFFLAALVIPFVSSEGLHNIERLKKEDPQEAQLLIEEITRLDNHFQKVIQQPSPSAPTIPSVIHFIWVGAKDFPQKYLSTIESWHRENPSYEILLWSDRPRALPLPFVKVVSIDTLPLKLAAEYQISTNGAEKADILRYEILEKWGGIYSDLDVECHQSFDFFVNHYDFFVATEDIWAFLDRRFLKLSSAIYGASPHHRFLQKTIENVQKGWIENTRAVEALSLEGELHPYLKMILVLFRTYLPFSDAILQSSWSERDIILPASYFGMQGNREKGLYCTHFFDSSWHPEKLDEEIGQFQKGKTFKRKFSWEVLIMLISSGLLLFLWLNRKKISL